MILRYFGISVWLRLSQSRDRILIGQRKKSRSSSEIAAIIITINGPQASPIMKNGKMKKNPVSLDELDMAMMRNPMIDNTIPRIVSLSDPRNSLSHTNNRKQEFSDDSSFLQLLNNSGIFHIIRNHQVDFLLSRM